MSVKFGKETLVKVCGLQSVEAASEAIESGADLLGIICVPGRKRTVEAEVAVKIAELVHGSSKNVKLVGVFRNQSKEDVLKIANEYNVDMVQLHGDEPWKEYQTFLNKPLIKRFIYPRDCEEVISLGPDYDVIPLFDSEAGGSGELLDWKSIADWAAANGSDGNHSVKFILAGGLTPDNVKTAVSLTGVAGVDVSGGVETDGAKDLKKIRQYVENAKN